MKKYTSLTTLVTVIAVSILLSSCGKTNTTSTEGGNAVNTNGQSQLVIGSSFTTISELQNAMGGMSESAGLQPHDQIFLVNSTVSQVSGGTNINLFNLFSVNLSGGVYSPNLKEEELIVQSAAGNSVTYLRSYDFGAPSTQTLNKATLMSKIFAPSISGLTLQGSSIRAVSITLKSRFNYSERTVKGYLVEHQMAKTTFPPQVYFIQYIISTELPLLANPIGEFNNFTMSNRQLTGIKSEDVVRVF